MCRRVREGSGDWSSAGIKLDESTIATSVAKAVRNGKYLQLNLKFDGAAELPEVIQAVHCLRKAHAKDEWGWDLAVRANIQDSNRATLVLMGIEKTGTKGHLDWTEARNIAFAIDEVCNERLAMS